MSHDKAESKSRIIDSKTGSVKAGINSAMDIDFYFCSSGKNEIVIDKQQNEFGGTDYIVKDHFEHMTKLMIGG